MDAWRNFQFRGVKNNVKNPYRARVRTSSGKNVLPNNSWLLVRVNSGWKGGYKDGNNSVKTAVPETKAIKDIIQRLTLLIHHVDKYLKRDKICLCLKS